MRRTLGLLGLLAVVACGDATAPSRTAPLYADAIRVPWNYGDSLLPVFWSQMQQCSGHQGTMPYREIAFFNIPRDQFPFGTPPDTGQALGMWVPNKKHIYVIHLDQVRGNNRIQRILKHEMMHALLEPMDTHNHPPEWFGPDGPCGDLMEDSNPFHQY